MKKRIWKQEYPHGRSGLKGVVSYRKKGGKAITIFDKKINERGIYKKGNVFWRVAISNNKGQYGKGSKSVNKRTKIQALKYARGYMKKN